MSVEIQSGTIKLTPILSLSSAHSRIYQPRSLSKSSPSQPFHLSRTDTTRMSSLDHVLPVRIPSFQLCEYVGIGVESSKVLLNSGRPSDSTASSIRSRQRRRRGCSCNERWVKEKGRKIVGNSYENQSFGCRTSMDRLLHSGYNDSSSRQPKTFLHRLSLRSWNSFATPE